MVEKMKRKHRRGSKGKRMQYTYSKHWDVRDGMHWKVFVQAASLSETGKVT